MATTEDRHTLDAALPGGDGEVGPSPSRLYRWGAMVARRRRTVLGLWMLVLVLCAAAYPDLQKELSAPDYQVKYSQSARAAQLIERRFPALGREVDALVFTSKRHIAGDRVYRRVIASVTAAMHRRQGVKRVLDPYDPNAVGQISSDEATAVTLVSFAGSATVRYNQTRAVQNMVTRIAGDSGVRVWLTGPSPVAKDLSDIQATDSAKAEAIGLPVAFAILLLALGSLVSAMLPLLLALSGLLLADGALIVLTQVLHLDGLVVAIMTMIGMGIGIDYALFIVSRFQEELARSSVQASDGRGEAERTATERTADAIGVALATSGRTILFSGAIVALSMAAMFVVDFAVFQEIAVGAVVVVACMLAAAMTLLPAVLALLGERIDRGRMPWRRQAATTRSRRSGRPDAGWARWAHLMMRHPLPAASIAVAILALFSLPLRDVHYGINIGVLSNASTSSGKGQELLARSFSPGVMTPIELIISGRDGQRGKAGLQSAAASLTQELERDNRVVAVIETRSKSDILLSAIPSVRGDTPAATALVQHIRRDLMPPVEARGGSVVLAGGPPAATVDFTNQLRVKFPLILALILGPSFLFLIVVFRSIVLPLKAILMNLLATSATMGLVVWVFQDGHGHHLLNFTSTGFIQSTVPLIMFAFLFGLSMDYEVFLIRRIQEEWRKTDDNRLAVAAGIEYTARPIAAAAAIMVAVFGSFVTAGLLELKQLGLALAVAIALDATLIRLVLVPALMRVFGSWNWWLPVWLERVLPSLGGD